MTTPRRTFEIPHKQTLRHHEPQLATSSARLRTSSRSWTVVSWPSSILSPDRRPTPTMAARKSNPRSAHSPASPQGFLVERSGNSPNPTPTRPSPKGPLSEKTDG